MRKLVLLLASMVTVLLLASGMVLAQEADAAPETTLPDRWDHPDPYENVTNATFYFSSNDPGATFECKFDAGAYYTATVTTGAKDLAGYSLDQNPTLTGLQPKTWTFRVRT